MPGEGGFLRLPSPAASADGAVLTRPYSEQPGRGLPRAAPRLTGKAALGLAGSSLRAIRPTRPCPGVGSHAPPPPPPPGLSGRKPGRESGALAGPLGLRAHARPGGRCGRARARGGLPAPPWARPSPGPPTLRGGPSVDEAAQVPPRGTGARASPQRAQPLCPGARLRQLLGAARPSCARALTVGRTAGEAARPCGLPTSPSDLEGSVPGTRPGFMLVLGSSSAFASFLLLLPGRLPFQG